MNANKYTEIYGDSSAIDLSFPAFPALAWLDVGSESFFRAVDLNTVNLFLYLLFASIRVHSRFAFFLRFLCLFAAIYFP
jgi:hypothetical protein